MLITGRRRNSNRRREGDDGHSSKGVGREGLEQPLVDDAGRRDVVVCLISCGQASLLKPLSG